MNVRKPTIDGVYISQLLKNANATYVQKSDLINYMTTASDQTISGKKEFNKIIVGDEANFNGDIIIGDSETDTLNINSTCNLMNPSYFTTLSGTTLNVSEINSIDTNTLLPKLNALVNIDASSDLQFTIDYLINQNDFLTQNIASNVQQVQAQASVTTSKLDTSVFDTFKNTNDSILNNMTLSITGKVDNNIFLDYTTQNDSTIQALETDKLEISTFNDYTNLNDTNISNIQTNILDLQNNKTSKSYVDNMDNQINDVLNNLTSSKADISYVLAQDALLNGSITSLTNSKASKTEVNNYVSDLQTQIDTINTSKATKSYVDGQISNLIGTASTTYDTLGEIQTILSNNQNSINDLINSYNSQVSLSGNNIFTGTNSFVDITLNGNSLNDRLTTDETNISNLSTSITNLTNTKQDILLYDSIPSLNSTNILTSGSLYSALSNYNTKTQDASIYQTIDGMGIYVLNSSLSNYALNSSLSNYPTNTSLNSTLSNYVLSTTLSNYPTTTSLNSTLSNYLTTSNASSTYQTISNMSNYAGLSSNNNFTNSNNFSNISESINTYGSISSNTINLSYTTNPLITLVTPVNTTNNSLVITNVPNSTNKSYTFTIMFDTSTYKSYISQVNVNGNGLVAPKFINGSTSVNSSSNLMVQSISIIYNSSSGTVPFKILSSISSFY